jgi:hypothetical protein
VRAAARGPGPTMSVGPGAEAITNADQIKRTSGPQTTNGKRWEVQISATPSREWQDLFKASGELSSTVVPRRLEFEEACVVFQSDEDHVKAWIESIDKWIASTNARHRDRLERMHQERSDRLDAAAKEKDRIQQLNDRFRNL